jgi:TAG lipase/lysophosphatidylethanolamine acyltransferase
LQKLKEHWFRPSAFRRLLGALENATTYEQWNDAAMKLDTLLGFDMWRNNPTSKDYDFRLINDRLSLIDKARQAGDVYGLINALRAGLVRNLGNVNSPKLFNKAFAGTKYLIHEYISQYVDAIEELTSLPPPDDSDADLLGGWTMSPDYEDGEISGGGFGAEPVGHSTHNRTRQLTGGMAKATMSAQNKLDFIHDSRQGFGRTALVLQGGAIFGLCHLGVVKALLLQGLLPRIIVGTATGAIMGALVSVHPDKDLLRVLNENEIDVSAFASHGSDPAKRNVEVRQSMYTRWGTLLKRIQRFRKEGYFLDVTILEECVRANIGDLTFEEAFNRSKRILNITVVPAGQEGLPTLLNYITAPNVVRPLFDPSNFVFLIPNHVAYEFTAGLDRRRCLECLVVRLLRAQANQDPVQGRPREHHSLVAHRRGRLPALDVGQIHGP